MPLGSTMEIADLRTATTGVPSWVVTRAVTRTVSPAAYSARSVDSTTVSGRAASARDADATSPPRARASPGIVSRSLVRCAIPCSFRLGGIW